MKELEEKIARELCFLNGIEECHTGRHSCTVETCGGWTDFRDNARAALRAIENSRTHTVVPVEPTEAMTLAMATSDLDFDGRGPPTAVGRVDRNRYVERSRISYDAMLSARPRLTGGET